MCQEISLSPQAILMAQKLFDFLHFTVEMHYDTSRQPKLLDKWAVSFDRFFKKQKPEYVIAVFDFYINEWRKKRGYIHITPESFIGDFPLIAQRHDWDYRPIPAGELRNILKPLSLERWDCEWDKLVTSVSQSLYNIRLFVQALKLVDIPDKVKREIRAIFGHVQEYTTRYYLEWRTRQIEAVWTATITQDKIFNEVRKCLTRYGSPAKEVKAYLHLLQEAYNSLNLSCGKA